jgi:hypothetical protein
MNHIGTIEHISILSLLCPYVPMWLVKIELKKYKQHEKNKNSSCRLGPHR